jgi:hypothetical protein
MQLFGHLHAYTEGAYVCVSTEGAAWLNFFFAAALKDTLSFSSHPTGLLAARSFSSFPFLG